MILTSNKKRNENNKILFLVVLFLFIVVASAGTVHARHSNGDWSYYDSRVSTEQPHQNTTLMWKSTNPTVETPWNNFFSETPSLWSPGFYTPSTHKIIAQCTDGDSSYCAKYAYSFGYFMMFPLGDTNGVTSTIKASVEDSDDAYTFTIREADYFDFYTHVTDPSFLSESAVEKASDLKNYFFNSNEFCTITRSYGGTSVSTCETKNFLPSKIYFVTFRADDNHNAGTEKVEHYFVDSSQQSHTLNEFKKDHNVYLFTGIYSFVTLLYNDDSLKNYVSPEYNSTICEGYGFTSGTQWLNKETYSDENDYDSTNRCCESSEQGIFNKDMVCTEDGWIPFLDDGTNRQNVCAPGDSLVDYTSYTYQNTDGSDGCCGDDNITSCIPNGEHCDGKEYNKTFCAAVGCDWYDAEQECKGKPSIDCNQLSITDCVTSDICKPAEPFCQQDITTCDDLSPYGQYACESSNCAWLPLIQPDSPCSGFDINLNYCGYLSSFGKDNCTRAGCSYDYGYSNSCEGNRFCYQTNPADGSCIEWKDCKTMEEGECNHYPLCSWNVSHPTCTGDITFTCEDQYTESDCQSPLCSWNPLPNSSDYAYVTPNQQRYFCNLDEKETDGVTAGITYKKEESHWNWWDAYAHNVPFKIHTYLGNDYISNGEKWFVCNATGIVKSDANSIPENGTFTSATNDNNYFSCVDLFNTPKMIDYFQNAFPGDPGDPNAFPGYFDSCLSSDPASTTFCCGTVNVKFPGYSPTAFSNGDCLGACYVTKDTTLETYIETNDGSISDSLFAKAYCKINPYDTLCATENGFLTWTGGLQDKFSCGFDLTACLGQSDNNNDINLNNLCSDIAVTRWSNGKSTNFVGDPQCKFNVEADQLQYCANNNYVLSKDVVNPPDFSGDQIDMCCLVTEDQLNNDNVCATVPEPLTEDTCIDIGGDYLPEGSNKKDYVCVPTGLIKDNCCIGGKWLPNFEQLAADTLAQPESFICYDHNNENRISECCTDYTVCNNYYINDQSTTLFSSTNNKFSFGFFGKGGVLHSLNNYDLFELDSSTGELLLRDKFASALLNRNKPFKVDFLGPAVSVRNQTNWLSFDNLEFDFAFTQNQSVSLKIFNKSGDDSCELDDNLFKHIVNGDSPFRWHHVVISLSDFKNSTGGNCSLLGKVAFAKLFTPYTENNFFIAVDNFFLSENGSVDTKRNTDNYYCTGNFGSWIENLDGPTDAGFTQPANIKDYGPYWYACESQASFDWSGSRCCGDDTRRPYFLGGVAEYYNDSSSGCFHGNTVYDNWRVGDTLNDHEVHGDNQYYDNLLFYNKQFFACKTNLFPDLNQSYNGTGWSNKLLISKVASPWSIKGDFICTDNNVWVSKDSVSFAKVIAAKMYNLTAGIADFDIYCESFTNVTPIDSLSTYGLEYVNKNINDFCTYRYNTSNGQENILTGMSLTTDVHTFLNYTAAHLILQGQLSEQERTAFSEACDGAVTNTGDTSADSFFNKCTDVSNQKYTYHFRYNPDMKILFMTQDYKKNSNDPGRFDSLFINDWNFVQILWNNFLDIFRNWFGNGNSAGLNTQWTKETLLPTFSIDYEYMGTNDNLVTLKKLILTRRGTKQIKGLMETRANTGSDINDPTKDNDLFIVLEYQGFNTSVKKIVNRYITHNHQYELGYMVGNNTQIISLVNPPMYSNDGENTFEAAFDWRRLGVALDVNEQANNGSTFTQKPHNGVVDYGEFCDDTSDGSTIVYKFNNNSCSFWKPEIYITGNVSCNTENNTLNYDNCHKIGDS